MGYHKEQSKKYQNILKTVYNLPFDSKEKELLIELLNEKINKLNDSAAYCQYWHDVASRETDWEDPRL